ncbi:hypothetical protein GCM10025876_10100 [Demequina litorisediminis]|uniref:ABC transmembrane type-1 domain-containing protein n=1 Tax=Demequina litorisediminis TaxID=1849022 RepID=A0ABQ6IBH0_9MICO|nr:hypothetical protein GCM10025876_10100 [Demequina litorisediminis]
MLLNYRDRGAGFFRSSFYAPSLIGASVSVAIVWRAMFSSDGPVDNTLSLFGLNIGGWVGNVALVVPMMILLAVWQFGAPMVIFLAGLKQVPRELYEAADMDGAGPVKKFRSITLPMLSSVVFFNLLLEAHRRLPGVLLGVHHLQRHRWPRRHDELLHLVLVQAGVQ